METVPFLIKKYDNLENYLHFKYLPNSNYYINNYINICKDTKFCINNYLNKCKKVFLLYSTKYNINFYIYSNKIDTNDLIKLYNNYKRILILKDIYNIKKNINFHISFSSQLRYIPNKNEVFKPKHINGGFTNPHSNDIYIVRKQEYSKVIIHEFLHHVSDIQNTNFSNSNINLLKKKFNISILTELIPIEAIIEFWATIYILLFISIDYSINFDLLIKKEINHSLILYNKIINNFNYKWHEYTNAFSYIVFKLILLIKYKTFMKIKHPYNGDKIVKFLINNYKLKNINNYNNDKKFTLMLFSDF